jgi:hypothetical protein
VQESVPFKFGFTAGKGSPLKQVTTVNPFQKVASSQGATKTAVKSGAQQPKGKRANQVLPAKKAKQTDDNDSQVTENKTDNAKKADKAPAKKSPAVLPAAEEAPKKIPGTTAVVRDDQSKTLQVYEVPVEFVVNYPDSFKALKALARGYLDLVPTEGMVLSDHYERGVPRDVVRYVMRSRKFLVDLGRFGKGKVPMVFVAPSAGDLRNGPWGHYTIMEGALGDELIASGTANWGEKERANRTICRCKIEEGGLCHHAMKHLGGSGMVVMTDVAVHLPPRHLVRVAMQCSILVVSSNIEPDASASYVESPEGLLFVNEAVPGSGTYGATSYSKQYAHLWMSRGGGDFEFQMNGGSVVIHVDGRGGLKECGRGLYVISVGGRSGMVAHRWPPMADTWGAYSVTQGCGYVLLRNSGNSLVLSQKDWQIALTHLKRNHINDTKNAPLQQYWENRITEAKLPLDARGKMFLFGIALAWKLRMQYKEQLEFRSGTGLDLASDHVVAAMERSSLGVARDALYTALWSPFSVGGMVNGQVWVFNAIYRSLMLLAWLILSAAIWWVLNREPIYPPFSYSEYCWNAMLRTPHVPGYWQRALRHTFGFDQLRAPAIYPLAFGWVLGGVMIVWSVLLIAFRRIGNTLPGQPTLDFSALTSFGGGVRQFIVLMFGKRELLLVHWIVTMCRVISEEMIKTSVSHIHPLAPIVFGAFEGYINASVWVDTVQLNRVGRFGFITSWVLNTTFMHYMLMFVDTFWMRLFVHMVYVTFIMVARHPFMRPRAPVQYQLVTLCPVLELDEDSGVHTPEGCKFPGGLESFDYPVLVQGACAAAQNNLFPFDSVISKAYYEAGINLPDFYKYARAGNRKLDRAPLPQTAFGVGFDRRTCPPEHAPKARSYLFYALGEGPVPIRALRCDHNVVAALQHRYYAPHRPPICPDQFLTMLTPRFWKYCRVATKLRATVDWDDEVALEAYIEKLRLEGKYAVFKRRESAPGLLPRRSVTNKTDETLCAGNVKKVKPRPIVMGSEFDAFYLNPGLWTFTKHVLAEYEELLAKDAHHLFYKFAASCETLGAKYQARNERAADVVRDILNSLDSEERMLIDALEFRLFGMKWDVVACDGSWTMMVQAIVHYPYYCAGLIPYSVIEEMVDCAVQSYLALVDFLNQDQPLEVQRERYELALDHVGSIIEHLPETRGGYRGRRISAAEMHRAVMITVRGVIQTLSKHVIANISAATGSGSGNTSVGTTLMVMLLIDSGVSEFSMDVLSGFYAPTVNNVLDASKKLFPRERLGRHQGDVCRLVGRVIREFHSRVPILGNGDDTDHIVFIPKCLANFLESSLKRSCENKGFTLEGEIEEVDDLTELAMDFVSKLAMPAVDPEGNEVTVMTRKLGRMLVMAGAADANVRFDDLPLHMARRLVDIYRDHSHDPLGRAFAEGLLRTPMVARYFETELERADAGEFGREERGSSWQYQHHVDVRHTPSDRYQAFINRRYGFTEVEVAELIEYLSSVRFGQVLRHPLLRVIIETDC